MLTVLLVVALLAVACTIVAALGKCPIWIPVFLLCVIELVRVLPLGK